MSNDESRTSLTIANTTDNLSRHDIGHTRIGTIDIYKTSVGTMDNNCYFLVDARAPHNSLLIDASADADHLNFVAKQLGITITTIITTHSHSDHVQALAELVRQWSENPVRHLAPALDAADVEAQTGVAADQQLHHGDTVTFGADATLDISICRGHTAGGACCALTDGDSTTHIFVGDCLFPGGVGATKTPAAFTQLLDDVTHHLFNRYPDNTVIHPGHGNGTTLGAERPQLDEWRVRGW